MKRRLCKHLVCPIDNGPLEVIEWDCIDVPLSPADIQRADRLQIDHKELTQEIMTGLLVNHRRRIVYPIHDGVPRMLCFSTGVAQAFQNRYSSRLKREMPGYDVPSEASQPGEQEVLRTFSSEWVNYDWDGETYWNLTPEAWFRCMKDVLGLARWPVSDKLVLEVGIGVGGVANYVSASEGAEVVGMDLGYSVDPAFKHFGKNPFLHIVQASAFAPPFPKSSFDFVYSFGVIHHTFSTKTAFDSLARLPKTNGRLYVWVYSDYDESRNLVRRTLMSLETLLRPTISRLPTKAQTIALLPFIPLYMGYQFVRAMRHPDGAVRYRFREALHAARDRFTPRYVHRHSEAEVSGWFREAGFDRLECGSETPHPDYVPTAFLACTGVSGIRV